MVDLFLNFQNLDLLSVGVAVAGMIILGFVTFLNNFKSISNRTLFYLAIAASTWGIVNYSFYQVHSAELSLWLLRFVMFFAVWAAFFTFTLAYVFPAEKIVMSWRYKWIIIPFTIFTALLTLTPLVFAKIAELNADGSISKIINGPGIAIFGLTITFLNLGGIILLIRKITKSKKEERMPMRIVLFGIFFMLFLIMAFNFLLPAFFDVSRFIPLGAVFLFPFIALTSYAMLKHHLLGVKIIATEILTFVLAVVSIVEIVIADTFVTILFRSIVFVLVLAIGILLIRSVRKEVEQRERLQVLTQELEEYVGFAAHQVRGPMAVVKGFAQLIADGTYGAVSAEAKEKAEKIKEKSDELIGLVNNMLDVRKIEEGEFLKDLKPEDTDIVDFLKGFVEGYKIVAGKKNLALSFESQAPQINLKIDREKIRQVIQNLLDNSIKYTKTGFIKVGVKDEGKTILISVSDSGNGLSKTLREKLFQRFVRGEETKREIQGTGLGLYIAKQIVTAHKGEIWATSEGEGKGSQFYVRLSKQ